MRSPRAVEQATQAEMYVESDGPRSRSGGRFSTDAVMRFTDKAILVTGGGGGIGRAACLAFAREAGRVLIADADVAEGERTLALVREAGGEAIFFQVDVACDAQCASMVDAVLNAF